jgi:hypothetical protein
MLRLSSLLGVVAFLCSEVRGQNDTSTPTPLPVLPADNTNATAPPDPVPTTNNTNGTGTETPATMAPTSIRPECYVNLTTLAYDLLEKDPFDDVIYNLCPNTVFEIGSTNTGRPGVCCPDGNSPLVPRSNTRIICGADGNRANNCTLVGGEIQILFLYTDYSEQAENVVIQGVTFMRSTYAAGIFSNGGDITFKDCVFQVRLHTASRSTVLPLSAIFHTHTPLTAFFLRIIPLDWGHFFRFTICLPWDDAASWWIA